MPFYFRSMCWYPKTVLFKRSRSLATDDSLDKLIKYVPSVCKGKFILWTHVTSPLFQHSDYIEFIKTFLKYFKKNKIKSAFSANKIQKFLFRKRDNKMETMIKYCLLYFIFITNCGWLTCEEPLLKYLRIMNI